MLLTKTNEIKTVKKFLFKDSSLILTSGNNIKQRNLFVINKEKRNILLEGRKITSFVLKANTVFVNANGNCNQYDLNNQLLEYYENITVKLVLKEDLIAVEAIDQNQSVVGIFDTNQKEIKYSFKFNTTLFLTSSDSLYLVKFSDTLKRNCLLSFDIKNLKIQWKVDLKTLELSAGKNQEYEIIKILGCSKDGVLWIALNNNTIISLKRDGSILHEISEIPSFKSDWLPSSIPLPEATILDTKNNILIGFAWEFYWEIDAFTGKVTFLDLTSYFKELTIRNDLNHFVLSKTHIFFASRNGKLGALNRITFKVDRVYNFEKSALGETPIITEVKGNEQYLGALDLGGTLHIFEKENISR